MQNLVFLLISACLVHPSVTRSCNVTEGTCPHPIINSKYVVLPSKELCCPLHQADSNCISEEQMACHCQGGLVFEPCHHCKTCAKLAGEKCGGAWGSLGRCDKGLMCIVDPMDFLQGEDISGICVGKEQTSNLYEQCGGPYGTKGRCINGLVCSVSKVDFMSGADISGWCLNPTTAKMNCFKTCASRGNISVCGSDGRIYINNCFLRQQNCPNPPIPVERDTSWTLCEESCPDIAPPGNGSITFSNGINRKSTARITCNHGFSLHYKPSRDSFNSTPTLICGKRAWLIKTSDGRRPWSGIVPKCRMKQKMCAGYPRITESLPVHPDEAATPTTVSYTTPLKQDEAAPDSNVLQKDSKLSKAE